MLCIYNNSIYTFWTDPTKGSFRNGSMWTSPLDGFPNVITMLIQSIRSLFTIILTARYLFFLKHLVVIICKLLVLLSLHVHPILASALDLAGRIQFNELCPSMSKHVHLVLSSSHFAIFIKNTKIFEVPKSFLMVVVIRHMSTRKDSSQCIKQWNWNETFNLQTKYFHRPNVENGTYILSALTHDYTFDQVGVLSFLCAFFVTKGIPPVQSRRLRGRWSYHRLWIHTRNSFIEQ